MKIILPHDAVLVNLEGLEVTPADLADLEDEVEVAVLRDGERLYGVAKARPADSTTDLVELRLMSSAIVRLPPTTQVLIDGGMEGVAAALTGGPCDSIQPAREAQRRWHNEWQTIRVPAKHPPGASILQSWTAGVVEIVREKLSIELVVPVQLFELEIDGDAVAVTAPGRDGELADGILVKGAA